MDAKERAAWLRKLDRATTTHERTRRTLDELIADARKAGVPLVHIAEHTPYSREWARTIADRVDEERAGGGQPELSSKGDEG
jgi:nicotinamidase-related amidase